MSRNHYNASLGGRVDNDVPFLFYLHASYTNVGCKDCSFGRAVTGTKNVFVFTFIVARASTGCVCESLQCRVGG